MDLSSNSLIGLINKRMDYLTQRQRVLAQNVSNANTPNYRAQDMKESDFAKAVKSQTKAAAPAITHPGHLSPLRQPDNFCLKSRARGHMKPRLTAIRWCLKNNPTNWRKIKLITPRRRIFTANI